MVQVPDPDELAAIEEEKRQEAERIELEGLDQAFEDDTHDAIDYYVDSYQREK